MRKSFLVGLILSLSPMLAQAAGAADPNAACRLPFEKIRDYNNNNQHFSMNTVLNENQDMAQNLRLRYIVGDFNSTDDSGFCRGIQEKFAPAEQLSDFANLSKLATLMNVQLKSLMSSSYNDLAHSADRLAGASAQEAREILRNSREIETELADLRNYYTQVAAYAKPPLSKGRIDNGFCIGENLNYCEIKNPKFENGELVGGEPTLVYKFVTSTSRAIPPNPYYYSPINYIHTRHWQSARKYTAADIARDDRLGGGDGQPRKFGGVEEMPNFMNFVPLSGYRGETQNGIHEIAGGRDSGGKFGAPVSLGCVRLNPYPAKLSRFFTPLGAKFYIYLDRSRYVQVGDAATGRGRGGHNALAKRPVPEAGM